jgi:trimeric autotransporter adhesin
LAVQNTVLLTDGTDPAWGQVSLTAGVTGTLPLANGGTGATSLSGAGIAALAADQTFTAAQRGTITTDNDLSFDQDVTNNFQCTPSGTGALTFTNHTAGQSGNILLINTGGHAISLAATTKGDANLATTISAAGTYWLSYYDDGTNAYVVTSAVFA